MARKRVLAVEDDPGFRELVEAILSAEVDLTFCGSAEEALAELEAGGYDLVVTDIYLLGMSGFEILARLRDSGALKSCPVVLCSGQYDEETRLKALAMGASGFLAKPFQPDALLATVRSLLR